MVTILLTVLRVPTTVLISTHEPPSWALGSKVEGFWGFLA